jgi:channel protein (hemolysin III family)
MQLSSIAYHSSQNKGKHQVVYRIIDKALIYILLFFSFAPFLSGLNQAFKILTILLVLTLIFAATTCIALVYNKNTLSMVGYFVLSGIYLYFLGSVRNTINQEALDLLLFSSLILFVGVVFYLNINYRFSHVAWHVLSASSSIVVFAAIFLLN